MRERLLMAMHDAFNPPLPIWWCRLRDRIDDMISRLLDGGAR